MSRPAKVPLDGQFLVRGRRRRQRRRRRRRRRPGHVRSARLLLLKSATVTLMADWLPTQGQHCISPVSIRHRQTALKRTKPLSPSLHCATQRTWSPKRFNFRHPRANSRTDQLLLFGPAILAERRGQVSLTFALDTGGTILISRRYRHGARETAGAGQNEEPVRDTSGAQMRCPSTEGRSREQRRRGRGGSGGRRERAATGGRFLHLPSSSTVAGAAAIVQVKALSLSLAN